MCGISAALPSNSKGANVAPLHPIVYAWLLPGLGREEASMGTAKPAECPQSANQGQGVAVGIVGQHTPQSWDGKRFCTDFPLCTAQNRHVCSRHVLQKAKCPVSPSALSLSPCCDYWDIPSCVTPAPLGDPTSPCSEPLVPKAPHVLRSALGAAGKVSS